MLSFVKNLNHLLHNSTKSPKSTNLTQSDFRNRHPFEKRCNESERIRSKYPDRIPIICEVAKQNASQIKLDRTKYLVPDDMTIGQFMITLRKRMSLGHEQAIFLFIESSIIPTVSEVMNRLYNSYKNEDGFLYITITLENTFG